uniref:hypothetical protein n=1 Tax=Acetatifactor sp. TaxID=1872090 RepID=UPI0040568CF6
MASIFNGLNVKMDAVFALNKHKPLGPFRAQDVRWTSDLRRPKWNVDSGATLTDMMAKCAESTLCGKE